MTTVHETSNLLIVYTLKKHFSEIILFNDELSTFLLQDKPESDIVMIGIEPGLTLHKEEGNVLFNDTLNTFYLRLYGVGLHKECIVPLGYNHVHFVKYIQLNNKQI